MLNRICIKEIYKKPESFASQTVTVAGWARTIRDSKAFGFIELNDGSFFKSVQIVFERDKVSNYDEIAKQNVGCSLIIKGKVILTPFAKQPFEINADCVEVLGTSSPISLRNSTFSSPSSSAISASSFVHIGRTAAPSASAYSFTFTKFE